MAAIRSGISGFEDLLKKSLGRNLFFSSDVAGNIEKADIVFVSVNTPTKTFGHGAGRAADLQYWEKTARIILANAKTDKIVVEKSTLPVRTAQAMEIILRSAPEGMKFEVLSNPEFLAEGTAMQDLENPDRILIGSRETESGLTARQELEDIYAHWIPKDKIVTSNVWSSELSKLVANAFLAQRISSINAISALCEKTGANIGEVARAVGMDSRIGPKFLAASVGFGGSCFKKDILHLTYLCQQYGLHEVAAYWESVVRINDYQRERFVSTMLQAMFNTLNGKKICLLGFAFKANTGDTRESPATYIAKRLLEEKAELIISDPHALPNARKDMEGMEGTISYQQDPYEAARGCHAIAVLTEWPIYKELDFQNIFEQMVKPAYIFDGRNIIDHLRCFDLGFNVYPIGKAALTHF